MSCSRRVVLLTGLAGLAGLAGGCGFRPLYGTAGFSNRVTAHLAAIQLQPDRERTGLEIYNYLRDLLTPRGPSAAPLYRLSFNVVEEKDGLAIESDESITRYNLSLFATYVLQRADSGQVLTEGQARATAAYNVIRSEYANLRAERDAQSRAAREVAFEIQTRLAVFFDRATT